jgi:hypothetical protein
MVLAIADNKYSDAVPDKVLWSTIRAQHSTVQQRCYTLVLSVLSFFSKIDLIKFYRWQ